MQPTLPKRHKAVVVTEHGKLTVQDDRPLPTLEPGEVMVKVVAAAINPVDAKMLDFSPAVGSVAGNDFSGTVVALGPDVDTLDIGDRVAGVVHGMNSRRLDNGAFAEYLAAGADLVIKLPDETSFTDAAGFGVGVGTAILGLFSKRELGFSIETLEAPVTGEDQEFVLVAGGSTATGTRAIQLLKLAGLRPITTCAPSHFDLVTRFGAEKAFDRSSPTVAAEIREYTGGELEHALDCVTQVDTTKMCYEALGRAGGRYVALEPPNAAVLQTRSHTVKSSWVLAFTTFGLEIPLDGEYYREARPDERALNAQGLRIVERLLPRGLIDPHPVRILSGGLEGVVRGVETIATQPPSGYKMVYPIDTL